MWQTSDITTSIDSALVWFRRDLRGEDHAALHHALSAARRVWCVFLFDRDILDLLLARGLMADRRVEFIDASLRELDALLAQRGHQCGNDGVRLIVLHGFAQEEIPRLANALKVQAVFANHDDDPAALRRDARVRNALLTRGIELHTYKDHVVFERSEVLSAAGTPYSVFTPYKRAWLKLLAEAHLQPLLTMAHAARLAPLPSHISAVMPTLGDLGFEPSNLRQLNIATGRSGGLQLLDDFLRRIDRYDQTRDFPGIKGPSYLSVHLRFGTVSIRELVRAAYQRLQSPEASKGAEVWLSELIWRDFYHQLLHHHPRVVSECFKPEYNAVRWEEGAHADAWFEAWCAGSTGYPLVDAAMHQINQTGYMHNRLRMVVASFLTKDLGIDWRRGEQYFADHLIDFDLAANNGGWQWAASTGCDAQPYFRIFNPLTQSERFDREGKFIRRYLPVLAGLSAKSIHAPWLAKPGELAAARIALGRDYPLPIVQHDEARVRTLRRFAMLKGDPD